MLLNTYLKNSPSDLEKLISQSFYDNYNAAGGKAYDAAHAFGVDRLTNVTGIPTVSKVAVMDADNNIRQLNGTDQYLTTVSYFDNLGRPIQVQTDNVQGLLEINSTQLDFAARAIQSKSTVNYEEADGAKTMDILAKTTYDKGGRAAAMCQKINNDRWEPLARNSYSPLGELNTKKLGCDVQNVDYTYNIRGWMTKLNEVDQDEETYKTSRDLFAMKLDYTGDFTGNITGQSWRTMDKVHRNKAQMTVAGIQAYSYAYDDLNRLLKADYSSSDATLAINGISTSMYTLGAANKAYDLNGNILAMNRQVNGSPVDQMTYAYTNSNRLDAVSDATADTDKRYFNELNTSNDDYTYDAMGNMVNDKNKGVTEIQYNHANLPLQIVRNNTAKPEDNGSMKYYYSAAGQKLMTEVSTDPSQGGSIVTEKTRVYLSTMVLKGGAIEFLGTAEGRALSIESLHKNPDDQVSFPNYIDAGSNQFRYEYQLKDHLGNLRVACRCGDPKRKNNGDVAPNNNNREPIRIVQQNDYDAWGLDFGSPEPTAQSSQLTDRFQYNSKERIQDLGIEMYDYGARHYDAAVGRWSVVDPLAEKYLDLNPYNYVANNPINLIDPDGMSIDVPDHLAPIDKEDYLNNFYKPCNCSNDFVLSGNDPKDKEPKSAKEKAKEGGFFSIDFWSYAFSKEGLNLFINELYNIDGGTGTLSEDAHPLEKVSDILFSYASGKLIVTFGKGAKALRKEIKIPKGFRDTGQFRKVGAAKAPILTNGKVFISPDLTQHKTEGWKMAKSVKDLKDNTTRMGTYDKNLIRISK